MYGSVPTQSSAKANSMAAVCGFAAVVAVAGAVSYSSSSALYVAAPVQPAQMVYGSAPVAPVVARSAIAAAPVLRASMAESSFEGSPITVQASGNLLPIALGATALTALATVFLGRKKAVYSTEPVAMLATSGDRLVWFPGAKAPAHLTGQYPGDRGFDPLGFSKDPKSFERMRIAEVFHGRLAMLGMVGCIAPELLLSRPAWNEVWNTVDSNRFILAALQIVAPIEYWRGNGGFSWKGGEAGCRNYPGFDPLGLTTEDTKLREIKNGRLAMIGMLGLEVQNHTTGKSPLANLATHLADPLHNNIAAGSVAMFSTTGDKIDRPWAPARPLWFPGAYAPAWLNGEFPGDRGFDPAGFAANKDSYARMRVAEVFHGRLAMLAFLGAVVPEYCGLPAWYDAPSAAQISTQQVATVVGICGLPEIFRGIGGFKAASKDRTYAGFDPLGLTTERTKVAEIKNGRLAMMALLGFEAQHHITGKSPIVNLLEHVKHPFNNNIAESLSHSWPVAMFATSGHKSGLWLPGAQPPAHLTGEFPGDRGFDPLNLAADPTVYARMRIAEIFHGRCAMLGVVSALVPELLGKGSWLSNGDVVDGLKWSLIGMSIAAPSEYFRGQQGFGWNKGTNDPSYPGFDPLNLTSERTKVAEIKNGRLAMAAIAGFFAQAKFTGDSPLANLAAHLANPAGANITTLAMFSTTGDKYRGLWFPNITPPAYLTGEFPGDRGFDPAGMSADPVTFERMRVAEVFHGRLAMLGVVGCILPEALGNGVWFEAGDLDWNRFVLASLQVVAPLEYWRGNGGFGWNGESEGRDRSYPGFDPMNLTDEMTKNAEIRNGRLAMTAMLGFEAQRHITGQGPWANLVSHVADPLNSNIASSLSHQWPVAMFAASGHKAGVWFPNVKPPAHLTGEFPGDRGFDPLNLAADRDTYARMRIAEVFHGRCAMIGVVAALVPELLGKGAWLNNGDAVDGIKWSLIGMSIAAPSEYFRGQQGLGWDKGNADPIYPGFDPMNMTSERTKVAEIKNGRLAMAAIAGIFIQAQATGASPLANLAAHLANPVGANITTLAMF